jgi:hypothetical protein
VCGRRAWGTRRVLDAYSTGTRRVLDGSSTGTRRVLDGYLRGTHRVLDGYSTGTRRVLDGYSRGTHGVLTGYPGGRVKADGTWERDLLDDLQNDSLGDAALRISPELLDLLRCVLEYCAQRIREPRW